MRRLHFILILLLGFTLLMAMIGFNLAIAADTMAHPSYGFTPEPPPEGGGDGGGGGGDDSTPPEQPITYVWVRLDQCDTVCIENYADADPLDQLLASVGSGTAFSLPAVSNAPAPFEVLAPVQLVHQSSGFIVEGTLSTYGDTRINVPYPGQWDVLLIGQPQFVTAEAIDTTGTNMAQLQTNISNAPVSLGMVQAGTETAQLVECPILCVIEPVEVPDYLPETGSARSAAASSSTEMAAWSLILIGTGALIYTLRCPRPTRKES